MSWFSSSLAELSVTSKRGLRLVLLRPTDPEASDDAVAINLASSLGDDTCIIPVKPPDYSYFMLSRTYYAGVIDASLGIRLIGHTPSYRRTRTNDLARTRSSNFQFVSRKYTKKRKLMYNMYRF